MAAHRTNFLYWLNDDEKALALNAAANGDTLEQIANMLHRTHLQFWKALKKDRAFEEEFKTAREAGLHFKADKLQTVHELVTDVATKMKYELFSKNLQWSLARLIPKTFGDQMTVNVQERPNVRKVLEDIDKAAGLIPAITTTATVESIDSDEERARRELIESML